MTGDNCTGTVDKKSSSKKIDPASQSGTRIIPKHEHTNREFCGEGLPPAPLTRGNEMREVKSMEALAVVVVYKSQRRRQGGDWSITEYPRQCEQRPEDICDRPSSSSNCHIVVVERGGGSESLNAPSRHTNICNHCNRRCSSRVQMLSIVVSNCKLHRAATAAPTTVGRAEK